MSAFYFFDRSLLLCAIVFFAFFAVMVVGLNVERLFSHPSSLLLELKESQEMIVDGVAYRLETIWSSPVLLLIVAIELNVSSPRRLNLLLGRDVVTDQTWSDMQAWRVWCQRG